MKIGIKYCGGCNPMYDRNALYEAVKVKYSNIYTFHSANSNNGFDYIWIISGCKRQCVNVEEIKDRGYRYIISTEFDIQLFFNGFK
ncbi:hypothetical protein [Serpentinicella alkaliphila]|uniref:CGGC domain-containing protein n=1 Tax=Serpentinicella alkaliphila TaxID=1734049 RepID=A0A4R2TZ53_9FIRM|nr:hypothetical protein [Serpentinicella alkaliphila]QUH26985.1 hypothetical protein HZR23_15500 [Serpentinicella alkaliphila]TCQ00583.1 hypothetical protein EDD79_102931 [Serpentinicella alkaliphila]